VISSAVAKLLEKMCKRLKYLNKVEKLIELLNGLAKFVVKKALDIRQLELISLLSDVGLKEKFGSIVCRLF
jgi:hypothetical protein